MEQVRLVTQIPSNSISKKQSESLNVRVNFSYQGPAKTGRLGAVVTQQTAFSEFDEIGSTRKEFSVDLPDSPTGKTGLYTNITGMPLAGCEPKSGYGVKVYALDLDGKPEFGCKNILTITKEEVKFELAAAPVVSPTSPKVGETVSISWSVTSRSTSLVTMQAVLYVHEGAAVGMGRVLKEYPTTRDIAPGQSVAISAQHTAEDTGSGQYDRDVEIKIFVDAKEVAQNWKEDAFIVQKAAELETLQVNIDPAGAGYVTTSPSPSGGTENNWQFPKGITVYVTAHPNSGYIFKSWSGEMTDTTAITAPVYAMTETRTITAHFEKVVVEQYTLSVSVNPYGGGTITKSPDKTTYTKGEYVTLYASPASGYDFDSWSGDATGYSASVTVVMDKNKSVVANFKKKLPDPYTKVTFTVKGDGFPFLTSYWILYHYGIDGGLWQDYLMHSPGDIITVRNVTSQGTLSCHCCSALTGEWSEQKYSREFLAEDGEDYRYDIASGIVYYR